MRKHSISNLKKIRNIVESCTAEKNDYWFDLGVRIGGPAVYAFAKWIDDYIIDRNDVSAVVFVARDGYLIKEIFDLFFNEKGLSSHYIYASRLLSRACSVSEGDDVAASNYKNYINQFDFGEGIVLIVDSNTNGFSSQKLINGHISNDTIGIYWMITGDNRELDYVSFQEEHYYTLYDWAIMELIFSSHESPAEGISNCGIELKYADENEIHRQENFVNIEAGVKEFCYRWYKNYSESISNKLVTSWINYVLSNPSEDDLSNFDRIYVSTNYEHDDLMKITPFKTLGNKRNFYSFIFKLKQLLWRLTIRIPIIHSFFHKINMAIFYGKYMKSIERLPNTDVLITANSLEKYDIVSFDLFDTLVRRNVKKPTDLFVLLSQKFDLGENFEKERIKAENKARAECRNEVTLKDIYDRLPDCWGLSKEKIMELECSLEVKACYPDPFMKSLFDELCFLNCQLIVISDMYLQKKVIMEVLESCGYSGFVEVYVSSNIGKTKSNGTLFEFVKNELGRDKKIIHIGDNFYADFVKPREHGFDSKWYSQ